MLVTLLPRRLRRIVERYETLVPVYNSIGLLALICLAFWVAIRFAENLRWSEAAWQVWQTVTTVGYGNQPAATLPGRLVTMFFGLVGMALLGIAISAWFDWRTDCRERRLQGAMDNPFTNGYLVINFPGVAKFTTLVRELCEEGETLEVCVVDSQIEQLPLSVRQLPHLRVHFVRGSLLSEATYRQAGVARSRAIIIFPQQTGVAESDATTKLVVELVSRMAPPETCISHILVSPDNEWLFAGSRSNSVLEIDEILVLVQECMDPLSANVLQDLLRTSNGINPRTFAPRHTVGWRWSDFQRGCVAAAETEGVRATPLALIRDNQHQILPSPDTTLAASDQVSLVVPDGFDWERFEELLHRHAPGSPG